MGNYNEALSQLYNEKENQIIIGLTGRTGSGCSTVAGILKKRFPELELEYEEKDTSSYKDKCEFEIIKNYIGTDERWIPFEIIEGSCVILSYVFEQNSNGKKGTELFVDYLRFLQSNENSNVFKIENFNELIKELNGLNYIFDEIHKHPLKEISDWNSLLDDEIDLYHELYVNKLSDYKNRIKKILLKYSCYEEKKRKLQDEPPVKYHLYTYILQKIANNIRASGNPYKEKLEQDMILEFAKRIRLIIELIRKHNKEKKTRICIDAIRNANESNYLKDLYRSYYLISINVDEKMRQRRLASLDIDEQRSLDYVEYETKLDNGKIFYHQNIANCFEMADIHLVNLDEENNRKLSITRQLVKYITLMIHPGLVIPSDIERCMQLAYNAKYNSGCLSRQVGAIVTGSDYSVKAVGWNDTPQKQLGCIYRDVEGYCKGNRRDCFSEYEYDDPTFKKVIEHIDEKLNNVDLHGRKFSYCFKDVYNGYTNEKNQVYTRALHAEENAFLQISKYGGQSLNGGFLFCTASPCELCSKKAFQLGITNIFYIDPYPGIAQKHILSFGDKIYNPTLHLFSGAIGEAYVRLYRPIMAMKDELELVSGISCKNEAKLAIYPNNTQPQVNDIIYHSIEFSIQFFDRENIESIRNVDMEVVNGEYSVLDRKLTWTGSSYDKSELVNNPKGYILKDSSDATSPYHYKIDLNGTVKKGERITYGIKSYVKDESHVMHEYFAQMIGHPTKKLILNVICPKKATIIDNVRYMRYADMEMTYEAKDKANMYKEIDEGEKIVYRLEINDPNLFYTYSLEWDFIKVKS